MFVNFHYHHQDAPPWMSFVHLCGAYYGDIVLAHLNTGITMSDTRTGMGYYLFHGMYVQTSGVSNKPVTMCHKVLHWHGFPYEHIFL